MHIRRTTFAALLAAGSLALTACGSSEPAARAGSRPGAPAQLPAARPHVLPRRDADAVRHVGRRGDAGLRADLRPGRRAWSNGLLGAGRHRPGRLAQRRLDGADRHLGDRHLALDRLQRADLPGRHAVDPARTSTRRPRSTAPTAGSSSCTSRCPACARRSCSRSSSRRSAPASCSASRCCSAAGRPTAGRSNQYQTLGLFMYQQGWQFGQLGRAATVAWVMFVLIIGLVLLNTWLARGGERKRDDRRRAHSTCAPQRRAPPAPHGGRRGGCDRPAG